MGVAAAAEGGLPGAVVREFPGQGGRAYFINGPFRKGPDPVDQLVLLLDVGAEGGCPGPVAVVLDLDEPEADHPRGALPPDRRGAALPARRRPADRVVG